MQTTGAIRPTTPAQGLNRGARLRPASDGYCVTSSRSDSSPGLETSLYPPVKRFLESLGYEVKGEIGGCDLVGVHQDGTVVVIGELKLRFNLDLLRRRWTECRPVTRSGLQCAPQAGRGGNAIRAFASSVVFWALGCSASPTPIGSRSWFPSGPGGPDAIRGVGRDWSKSTNADAAIPPAVEVRRCPS